MCPKSLTFWGGTYALNQVPFCIHKLILTYNKCLNFNKVCIYIGYEKA